MTIKTLGNQGSATAGKDYLKVDDIIGFTPGETEKTIDIQTLIDDERDNNCLLYTSPSPRD